jgi:hypothetical protein
LAQQPENPAVLAAAVQYHEALAQNGAAVDARQKLANLNGYEDDSRKQEAALWLGNFYSQDNPDLAYAYLWKALTWWYNSGNGGDLGDRIYRAIDQVRRSRKDRPKG